MATFQVKTFDVKRYHSLLDAGLSQGLGRRVDGEMCIEAAICAVLDKAKQKGVVGYAR